MLTVEEHIIINNILDKEIIIYTKIIGESVDEYLDKIEERKKDLKRHSKEVAGMATAGAVAGAAIGTKVAKKEVGRRVLTRKTKAIAKAGPREFFKASKKALLSLFHFRDPKTAMNQMKGVHSTLSSAGDRGASRALSAAKKSKIVPKTALRYALVGGAAMAVASIIAKLYNKAKGLEYEIDDIEDPLEKDSKRKELFTVREKLAMAKEKLAREKERAREKYQSLPDDKKQNIDDRAEKMYNTL